MFALAFPARLGRPKPCLSTFGGWGFASLTALSALSAPAAVRAQPTPAGTRITSVARVSYETASGLTFSVASDPLAHMVIVAQMAGVDVDPPRASVADPGSTVTFAHTIKNIGNGPDNYSVSARSQAGWLVRVYLDVNGNGVVDQADLPALQPVPLVAGASASLLVTTDIPAQPSLRGKTDSIHVVGVSLFDSRVSDTAIDQLLVRSAGIAVALIKSVDRSTATIGEILTYTVTYSASGTGTGSNFRLQDAIPLGTTYVPGTLRWNGTPLTDVGGDDVGLFDALKNQVVVVLSTIAGGQRGSISFQVRVER